MSTLSYEDVKWQDSAITDEDWQRVGCTNIVDEWNKCVLKVTTPKASYLLCPPSPAKPQPIKLPPISAIRRGNIQSLERAIVSGDFRAKQYLLMIVHTPKLQLPTDILIYLLVLVYEMYAKGFEKQIALRYKWDDLKKTKHLSFLNHALSLLTEMHNGKYTWQVEDVLRRKKSPIASSFGVKV